MTVYKTLNRKDYTATGSDTFAFDFKIYDETDLLVFIDGVLQTTGYTISGGPVWTESGANVVFGTAPTVGSAIAIIRLLPLTQGTVWPEGGPFPSASHEAAADRLVMIAQQFNEAVNRIFKVETTSLLTDIEVPEGAGKLIGWNAAGDAVVLYNQIIDTGVITTEDDMIIGGVGGIPERIIRANLKLDDWGVPDDNTDLDASISGHGLMPKTDKIKLNGIIDLIYPVGSIYISIIATNPGTLFGVGTWVAFGTGKTIVGLDAGQAEFDTIEETGGEKTHTLSIAEMPVHAHPSAAAASGAAQPTGTTTAGLAVAGSTTGDAGSGTAHNNLQPYIVVYMWKRTV